MLSSIASRIVTYVVSLYSNHLYRDEVVENESLDRSVHFVRWIKANNTNDSARRRESVKQATQCLITNKSDLTESLAADDSIQSIEQQQQTSTGWQCLEDAHGIELCTVGRSLAADDYHEMGGLEEKAWPMKRHSDVLC